MSVPYTFATVPNGSTIPLSYLDANFNYLSSSPVFSGNVTVTGTLGVGGAVTFSSTLGVTGNTTVGGTLGVTGNTTVGGTFGVVGSATFGTQQTVQGSIVLANTAAGAYSTTIKSSNSASAAWDLTLPPTAGTNKYVLMNNGSGVTSWSQIDLTTSSITGILPISNGGTNASSAGITAFNNISGYSASGATGNISTYNLVFSYAPTLTGIGLTAGTNTLPPVTFTSGTNLTNATAGAWEYDGNVFYATSVANSRQVVCTEQLAIVGATPVALSNSSTSAQNIFDAANDTLTVAGSTTYFFEAFISIDCGGTSHATAFGFDGNATFTSVLYNARTLNVPVGSGVTSTYGTVVNTAASTNINSASTATGTQIQLRGVLRINAGGTIIPQITFSAGPTGTCQVNTNSYFRIWPVGTNTVAAVGDWS